MSINILYAGHRERWHEYQAPLLEAFANAGLDVELRNQFNPEDVDFIIHSPKGPVSDFTPFTRLQAVLGLWAGVEDIVGNTTLQVPLTRMVDAGLTEGMVEWVTAHVLRHHIGLDRQILNQNGVWEPVIPPLARNRRVGFLGLGEIGRLCAGALSDLNFHVSGWSRGSKQIPGIHCLSGEKGLTELLEKSEILVLLLPATHATENILNADRIAMMPAGSIVLNPGRGALVDDAALLAALDRGQIAQATLDVFRTEPLPSGHPFWAHPKVTVTQHVASETRAPSSALVIAENVRRFQAGEPLRFVVDRGAGY